MPLSRAEIATPSGARLINRLCKHWAHKLEVEHSEQDAKIVFASGTCLMHADQLEGVVESHLMRMAKDESLEIVWEN